eukprot:1159965-Pelagomonas_calceolata.AAC.11
MEGLVAEHAAEPAHSRSPATQLQCRGSITKEQQTMSVEYCKGNQMCSKIKPPCTVALHVRAV